MEKKKVLFVVGSLRENSFNRKLALAAEEQMKGKMKIAWLNYEDLPYMNQDLEENPPESVTRCREQFLNADGVWFFTPEYNGMIPGGEKNMLDWMSRPLVAGNMQSGTALKGKCATASGVGGSFKTARVRAQLDDLLQFCGMNVMTESQTGVSTNVMETVFVISDEVKEELKQQGVDFIQFMERN